MLHELIANDPRVLEYTLNFIQHGWFISAEKRHPLPPVSAADAPRRQRPANHPGRSGTEVNGTLSGGLSQHGRERCEAF